MGPLEQDADPWEGTQAGRGEERDNPLDSGAVDSPFGPDPESVGMPNLVYGPQRRRAPHTPTPPVSRGVLLLWLVAFLGALVASVVLAIT